MKTHAKTLLTALTCSAGLTLSASAATIASYDFLTDTSSSDAEANSTANDFAATGTAFGAAARSSGSLNFFTRDGVTAFSAADYVGFTVDIDTGYELDLSALAFGYNANKANNAVADGNTATYSVRTSADGFTSDLAGTYSANPDVVNTSGDATETASFDLSGAAFQDLTGTFEVRIYSVLSVSSFEFINRYDDVLLTGDTALVPEPGSLALLGLGGLLIVRRRRGA